MPSVFKRVVQTMLGLAFAASTPVFAHGSHQGELQLDHPYAVPSAPDDPNGQAYLRGIQNTGAQADRLMSASTPVAERVVLHRLKPDVHGFRGMEVPTIALPPKSTTLLRHTGDYQLSLINLKKPLKEGDRFDLTLTFERAGSQTVKVWVQKPHAAQASHVGH